MCKTLHLSKLARLLANHCMRTILDLVGGAEMVISHVLTRGRGRGSRLEPGRGALYWSSQKEVMAQIVIVALLVLTAHVAVCQNEVRVVWSVDGVAHHQR